MGELIPFKSGIPAHLKSVDTSINNGVIALAGGGIPPTLSIKGKQFAIVRGDERKLLANPNDPESPATYVDAVLIRIATNYSKTYYNQSYEEGVAGSPDCSSINGITPDTRIAAPVSRNCQTCPNHIWGSGKDGKGRRCRDSVRVAVAARTDLEDVLLLSVPPASIRVLSEYTNELNRRGLAYNTVLTKISFGPESTPKLVLTARAFLDEEDYAKAKESYDSDMTRAIIGLNPAVDHDETETASAPAVEKITAEKAAAIVDAATKKAPAKKPVVVDEDAEAEAEFIPAKKKAPAKKPVVVDEDAEDEAPPTKVKKTDSLVSDLDALLDSFDD